MPISGTKNEPSGHSKVLRREQQTDQQMWKHFPVHCQILKRANVQLFQRRKQNLWNFLFTLQKLHGCTLIFLYLLFGSKNKGGLLATLSATISQIWARSPAPPAHNDSAK